MPASVKLTLFCVYVVLELKMHSLLIATNFWLCLRIELLCIQSQVPNLYLIVMKLELVY